ncbi:MAG: histone deacetylase family protein [Pseudomonadota bacterium]
MQSFYAPAQARHAPSRELQNGEMVPYAEKAERAAAILSAIAPPWASEDHGLAPIEAVHSAAYLAFLQRAHKDWSDAGRPGDAFPYVFPIRGRRPLTLSRIDAELGQFAYDCGTPIAEHTWQAAYWNAQTVISAMRHIQAGAPAAFALCRPPGHHAGADYMGGYCYLNTAAIAAEDAIRSGAERVAILDVDYHHGNGTQDIFYQRADVLTVSIHADPKTDYPFYWGHADETGEGAGAGKTLNLPLPRGTDWTGYWAALEQAIDTVEAFDPDILIVPYGADTYAGDPISFFKLETGDYKSMAEKIHGLNRPTLITMEGGYALDALGRNVASFLSGFA